jgi:hypothetical protein
LINNRQGGRRRGRGGQRGQNISGGPPGNRQDNRQRGNAAQLLEKYKSMARDSQLSGDRVQTEYYLQFADHYFRVLGESRARFEEQNPRRGRDDEFEDDDGDEEMAEGGEDAVADERPQQQHQQHQQQRQDRDRAERPDRDRSERFSRRDRPRSGDGDFPRSRENVEAEPRPANGAAETIAFDVLPPAIGRDETENVAPEEETRRPRRRTRAARPTEEDGEVAPAA